MIDLDEQQEKCLRDIADIAGRSAGERFRRKSRWIMRFLLSVHRFFRPKNFKRWNDARMADQ